MQAPSPSIAETFKTATQAFLASLTESLGKLANGEITPPIWHPPNHTSPEYTEFLENLQLPCTTAHPQSPNLLLHNLGDLTQQPEARNCLDTIFGTQVTYVYSPS